MRGEDILNRAVTTAVGGRFAKRPGLLKMKVKRMALEDLQPDRMGEPSDKIKGYPEGRPWNYFGDDTIQMFENGALLTVNGKPEWFNEPHKRWARWKAKLIQRYAEATKMERPAGLKELEKKSLTTFKNVAEGIEPDAHKPPKNPGGVRRTKRYGPLNMTIYEKGVLLEYKGVQEWYNIARRGEAIQKARLLAAIPLSKRAFE
jgi:hypothetical protein